MKLLSSKDRSAQIQMQSLVCNRKKRIQYEEPPPKNRQAKYMKCEITQLILRTPSIWTHEWIVLSSNSDETLWR